MWLLVLRQLHVAAWHEWSASAQAYPVSLCACATTRCPPGPCRVRRPVQGAAARGECGGRPDLLRRCSRRVGPHAARLPGRAARVTVAARAGHPRPGPGTRQVQTKVVMGTGGSMVGQATKITYSHEPPSWGGCPSPTSPSVTRHTAPVLPLHHQANNGTMSLPHAAPPPPSCPGSHEPPPCRSPSTIMPRVP